MADPYRILALTFGRPVMISKPYTTSILLPAAIDDEYLSTVPGKEHVQPCQLPSKIEFFAWTLRLYDILSEILSQFYASGRDDFKSSSMDVPNEKQGDEDFTSVLRLDRSLIHFWDALPASLKQSDNGNVDLILVRQSNVLRARSVYP